MALSHKLWSNNGKLVINPITGNLIDCPECACDGGQPATDVEPNCVTGCDIYPTQYVIEAVGGGPMTGFSDAPGLGCVNPPQCILQNTTITVTYFNVCEWRNGNLPNQCSAGEGISTSWSLQLADPAGPGNPQCFVSMTGSISAVWTLDADNWSCFGINTFHVTTSFPGVICNTVAQTLQVRPA